MVLEKTLESPLDCKQIKPVNPKGNQSWIFTGRTNAEAEAPILWPPDVKNWLAGKDPDAAKDWKQEENGVTENEMVGWHLRLNRHEFEQDLRVGDGQRSLACCDPSPWGRKKTQVSSWSDWLTEAKRMGLRPLFLSDKPLQVCITRTALTIVHNICKDTICLHF